MRFRSIELVFVVAIVAVVVSYFQQPSTLKEADPAPRPDFTPALVAEHEAVPSFPLTGPSGEETIFKAGQGPLLVVLTATGCGGCLERIDAADREAYTKAHDLDIPVWNLLVYQGVNGAQEFVDRHQPSADVILCDPQASVSVTTLGGSDATCWLLIDKSGKLAWRGPADPEALTRALETI